MRHAGQPKLIDHVMGATIPMRGRMIHGKRANGDLYEEGQDYDAHGRVRVLLPTQTFKLTDVTEHPRNRPRWPQQAAS